MKKLFILTLILSGCASSQGRWHKEGLTQDEYSKARYTCLLQAQQPESQNLFSTRYSAANATNRSPADREANALMAGFSKGMEQNQTGMLTNDILFEACMNANGLYWKQDN